MILDIMQKEAEETKSYVVLVLSGKLGNEKRFFLKKKYARGR